MNLFSKKTALVSLIFLMNVYFSSSLLAFKEIDPGDAGRIYSPRAGMCPKFTPKPPENFRDFVCICLELVQLAIPYAASSAFLAFIWGLSKFIFSSGDEEKIKDGKMIMKWGLIGLFFMFSIWGAIAVLTGGFGFKFGLPLLPE